MTLRTNVIITVFLLNTYNSYAQIKSSLRSQAQNIIANLKKNYEYPLGGKDTLIDLNGDNFKDILIEYYGLAGSGEKNRIKVYLYNNFSKRFSECEQLSFLANPTFYFDKKIVTGYYVANGG